jgi:hypothetical protein
VVLFTAPAVRPPVLIPFAICLNLSIIDKTNVLIYFDSHKLWFIFVEVLRIACVILFEQKKGVPLWFAFVVFFISFSLVVLV